MGMAAGQARLLSITSRIADNELRAQIINNNKMRLAAESSQASETYITALNDAQLMFTNYDANDNVSYGALTFNALTAYSPYNNQYALINSSNQILISETDAANFEKSEDLAEFLKCYGLEETTTYFDNLPTDENGFATYTYYDDDGNAYTVSCGFTPEALELAYFGEEEGSIAQIGGNVPIQDCGYDNVLNGVDMYDYVTALSVYTQAKADYLDQINELMEGKLDEIVKSTTNGAYKSIDDLIKKLQGTTWTDDTIKQFYNNYLYPLVATDMTNKYAPEYTDARPSNVVSETYKLATPEGKEYLYELEDKFSIPSCHCSQYHNDMNVLNNRSDVSCSNIKIQTVPVTVITNDDGNGNYVTEQREDIKGFSYKFNPGGLSTEITINWDAQGVLQGVTPSYTENGKTITVSQAADTISAKANGESGYTRYEITETWTEKDGTPMSRVTGIEVSNLPRSTDNMEKVKVLNEDGSITERNMPKSNDPSNLFELYNQEKGTIKRIWYTIPDTPEQKASDAVNLLQNLKGSLPMIWDQTSKEFAEADIDTSNAFKAYIEAANELYEVIYGQKTDYKSNPAGPPPMEALDNITELYNDQGVGGMPLFCQDMRPVYMNLVLDNVMDTYGEPKIAWINTDDPNDNSEKRTQWYTNLYNKINENGYHVLKDGLASSPEWIKFAFESGIVTMEQVDNYNAWNQLIYTNCSDITEQTHDKAIAIAEAEYNAAMNKIENKDKRYDLELKNIDTEHNSLQVEYESIKAAIDKNIERNFKYLT